MQRDRAKTKNTLKKIEGESEWWEMEGKNSGKFKFGILIR